MEIKFTYHAIQRIEERKVSLSEIMQCLTSPDKIDKKHSNIFRFIRLKESREKLLLILICKMENQHCTIITVFESSQISRYLK